MEFFGVEVKAGASVLVDPGKEMIVHFSQAALGEKKSNGNEPVLLYLKPVGGEKLLVGTLSHEKCPQLSTEIVVERPFELSHNWKEGSVFFTGYRVDTSELGADPAGSEPKVEQVVPGLPVDDDDTDSSDDSSEESGEEEEKKVTAEAESDEDDEDDSSDEEDSSEEDDTPEKVEESKKRVPEANSSANAVSNKKAKFVTPQKSTETKKAPHVHVATPHPSKQGGKSSGSNNGEASKTPKSAAAFGCNSCNRSFTSEMGLQSHTKAKHSAAA